jgi:copper chaperone CopZ
VSAERTGRTRCARYADGVIAEVFEVEGVRCPRCIEKIAAALSAVEGLQAADANLMGEISVLLDGPDAHARVQSALEAAGFPVACVRPSASL